MEVVQEVLGVGHGGGEPGAAVTIDVTIQLTEANGMVNSRNFQSFNGIYLGSVSCENQYPVQPCKLCIRTMDSPSDGYSSRGALFAD